MKFVTKGRQNLFLHNTGCLFGPKHKMFDTDELMQRTDTFMSKEEDVSGNKLDLSRRINAFIFIYKIQKDFIRRGSFLFELFLFFSFFLQVRCA